MAGNNIMTRQEKFIALAKAKTFQLWVKSIIGEEPELAVYDDYMEISFNDEQKAKMITYLNSQVRGLFSPTAQEPPKLQIRFGDVLTPFSLQYLAPLIALAFGGGYLSGRKKWF